MTILWLIERLLTAMIVPPMLPQVEPVLVNTETPVAAVDEQAPVAEAPAA